MKKLLLATAAAALSAGTAGAEDIKLGIIFGFTGPIESLTGSMAAAAEAAVAEVNASGKLLDGSTVTTVRGDSTCVDAAAATAVAETQVTVDKVNAIIGGDCSGVTGAILSNIAVPNGIVMISPSATSPALSTAEDAGLFFRTAPSDAREGEVAADILMEHGVKSAALTYTNNDYGKGLAEAIATSFKAKGGVITISAAHEDGKADYTAEVAALAAAGVIRAALDTGAFSTFELPGGMIGDNLTKNLGTSIDGSYGQVPGTDAPGMKILGDSAAGAFDVNSPYTPESYDAAALIMLAMQAAKSSKSTDFAPKIMDVANAPGEQIFPGELAKGLELIAAGTDIDYVGASNVELVGSGESAGNYREIEVKGGKIETVKFR
jgi:branched-chain amino acid transport system substrate-binding protein